MNIVTGLQESNCNLYTQTLFCYSKILLWKILLIKNQKMGMIPR